MELAQKYLLKYKVLAPPQASKAKVVAKTLKDECGIEIPHTDITLQRGGAIIACHPTLRSEIARNVPCILETLYKKHNLRLSFIR